MPGSGMVIQAGSGKHRPAGREKENDEKAEKDAGENSHLGSIDDFAEFCAGDRICQIRSVFGAISDHWV